MGRAGRCRQISLCVGTTHCVPATLGLPLLTGVCAFPVYTAQAPSCSIGSTACVACGSSFGVLHKSVDSVAPVCLPGPEQLRQPGAWWAHSPQVQRALSPPRPQPHSLRVPVGCQQLVFVLRSWPLASTLPVADVLCFAFLRLKINVIYSHIVMYSLIHVIYSLPKYDFLMAT